MIKKRKQGGRYKGVIFLIFLVAVLTASVRQRDVLTRYWTMLMLMVEQKDARALALSLRHEPLGIFCVTPNLDTAKECYLFDVNGVIFGRAHTVVGTSIVKVEEQSDNRPAMNASFVPPADWYNVRPILEAIRDKKISADRSTLMRANKELILTVLPPAIPFYFSYAFDPRGHLNALPEFRKKVSLEGLQYVDLRIEGRIFYR